MISEIATTTILGTATRTPNAVNNMRHGLEINLKRDYGIAPLGIERLAPWGNRTGITNPKTGEFNTGILPHYHRKGPVLPNGQTAPGQSKNRHRPWDSSKDDKNWKDKF